ncbi:MAG TPA: hypothetical protein VNT79_04370 [Phycisphaerae bacterium]|nr:hypothetical protein [Phycisphaerae bacterium]
MTDQIRYRPEVQYGLSAARPSTSPVRSERTSVALRATAGGEAVNDAVREHQLGAFSWRERGLVVALYQMCDALVASAFAGEPLGPVLISLSRNRCRRSRYRTQRDGMAIQHVIEFNGRWLRQLDDFQWLVAVAYEMLHAWQAACGAPPANGRFHNRQFLDEARAIGLRVGRSRNQIIGVGEDFFSGCGVARIAVPASPGKRFPLPAPLSAGKNTRAKWSCGCQEAQVGKRIFDVTCNRCGRNFERVRDATASEKGKLRTDKKVSGEQDLKSRNITVQ